MAANQVENILEIVHTSTQILQSKCISSYLLGLEGFGSLFWISPPQLWHIISSHCQHFYGWINYKLQIYETGQVHPSLVETFCFFHGQIEQGENSLEPFWRFWRGKIDFLTHTLKILTQNTCWRIKWQLAVPSPWSVSSSSPNVARSGPRC